ncbi:MAG: redoxin domain-containing protein [Planctomycetes bacterium]|nr:redoxin domain-containing protein [Planctomycetota bacterium]
MELQVLQSVLQEDEFKGAAAVAVCGESQDVVKAGAEKAGLKFSVIGDSDLAIIDAWGLRHNDAVPGKNTARPAAFFVTAEGKVARAIQPDNYRTRMDAAAIRDGLRLAMGK